MAPEAQLPADAAPLAAGAVIDGWRLLDKLHVGGMATLWAVRREPGLPFPGGDPALEKLPLIMKLPRIKGGEDPATIVGFEVEQMILPLLQGPHVPRFVARGDFLPRPYLVMERIAGASLRPRLDAAPLALDEVIEIGSRVASALHELHRQHLVHLDIKPSNILFRPDGTAVLVDFGLSRHHQLPDLLEEEFHLPMGTGPYMSPEQVQYRRDDPRSDLFALGVMLYHFATGRRPFGSPDTVRGLRKRLYTDPVPPRVLRPDCPPWLQELILKCLEVDPQQRWQSAAQLALALQHPLQVSLSARAEQSSRQRFKRWWHTRGHQPKPAAVPGVADAVWKSQIIMAAVDIEHSAPELLEQLRETVQRILLTLPGARLACVGVMKTARIGMDTRVDAQGQSLHVKQLVGLRHWARPIDKAMELDDTRLTFHVLEAPDAAAAIIDFAARTHVDHIVMGARGVSAMRRYLGSVSSQVVAQADCTVTVVRA